MIVKTKPSKAIYDYLNQRPIINENLIGIMENEPDAEIYIDNEDSPRGVLVRHGYFNYIYTEDDAFLDEVFENKFPEGFYGFGGISRTVADKIKKRHLINWDGRCTLYYLPFEKLDLGLIKNPVQSVELKDAEIVNEFYQFKGEGTLEKIQKDIKERPSSAVYIHGEPVCWVLVHNDNSMGIMYTKEEHRGKGYAVDVTIDLADKIIKMGKVPYLQIREENNMSPGLAAKCGFEPIGYADWFGIIVGIPQENIDGSNKGRYSLYKSLGEVKDLGDAKLLYTGVEAYNFVYDIKYNEINAGRVDEIIKGYYKLQENFIWVIDSRDEPEELSEILQKHGIRHLETKDCMHLPMDNFNSNCEVIEGFEVIEVTDTEGISLWCDTILEGLKLNSEEDKFFRKMIVDAVTAENKKLDLYLGRLNGHPVSTAAMNKFDKYDFGISFATVLPEMKDSKLFKTSIIKTIEKAGREELGWVTIQVRQEHVGIMKEIGFIHSHYLRNYGR